jgi:DNA-binding transcriptional regulator YhcF (GntR family)
MGKLELHLDRSVPVSLSDQIRGQITYAISYGFLNRGDPLPSVRELATSLQIAPMTVAHVYRDLSKQGLIVTRAGVGTFVADMAHLQEGERLQTSQADLRDIVENCVRQATLLGHPLDQVRQAFLATVEDYRSANAIQHILMVGNFAPATDYYAQEVEGILRDLNVRVHPVLLDDLQTNPDHALAQFKAARLAITVPTRLLKVRALLEPRHYRVAAVAFRPNAETRRRLSSISPRQHVGVVATFPEFLQTLADEVSAYVLLKTPLRCAHLGQARRICEMLKQIDVLVYASGSEQVLNQLADYVEAIEFRHAPEADSVNRLRPLIA